jgi:hypothetical protein
MRWPGERLKGDITRITVSGRVSGEHNFGGAGAGHTASVLRIVSPGATLATVADVKKGSEDKQERVEEGMEKGHESQVSVSGKFTSMRSKCNLKLVLAESKPVTIYETFRRFRIWILFFGEREYFPGLIHYFMYSLFCPRKYLD